MSLIHFANIVDHRPDILMGRADSGLRDFYNFLTRQRDYLESDAAVKVLAWEMAEREEDESDDECWVQLIEPEGSHDDFEATTKLFMDPFVKSIYESKKLKSYQSVFDKRNEIRILERDLDSDQLLLSRLPNQKLLVIRPNTYQINCQLKAINKLRNQPEKAHEPLLKLFAASDHAKWGASTKLYKSEMRGKGFKILTDLDRDGTKEQRQFVNQTLTTPDFAFLEGPPGSGKTTVICEIIRLLCETDCRVILCASTHVAVDNVLERLMDESNEWREHIVPIRIGDEGNVSDKAKPYLLRNFLKTEKNRILKELRQLKALSIAQKELERQVKDPKSEMLSNLVLESSNLVCGTTIGILQHPQIKGADYGKAQFDYMIIDEASKTTFQEFLVPALLAKRWVLVGDPKQLSPYVDDEALAVNIESCVNDRLDRKVALDTFLAAHPNPDARERKVICLEKESDKKRYIEHAIKRGVICVDADKDSDNLPYSEIVVGSSKAIKNNMNKLPLDLNVIQSANKGLTNLENKLRAHNRATSFKASKTNWQEELSWRLARLYEQRHFACLNPNESSKTVSSRLEEQIQLLLPSRDEMRVNNSIKSVKRVALPSILESLQNGFAPNKKVTNLSAIDAGLPSSVLRRRHTKLSYQHRMHPEIADFSHKFIYNEGALFSSDSLVEKRQWSYPEYNDCRAVWLESKTQANSYNINTGEAKKVIEELKTFVEWAKANPKGDGEAWKLAILTFYRGQERELRKLLRKFTKSSGMRYFRIGAKDKPYVEIQLCTVDRFQGHEADMVFLSFSKHFPTSFLESPNRLNVALTRARYQLVIVANRKGMKKSKGILKRLQESMSWGQKINNDGGFIDER